ncbi:SigE family RNA polymerase sigma factor [Spongiactinospora rosea]|uniref:SigE family RNA polymerase sigma factor n=1 Tax=Spongiactinospora rosea TaxID=2248750 RepID=A0A366LJL2_9ACTN|nr:SigE family RNA polymerase sigma factor [Spongiactinospora rosea]RBQ14051.1 SigE family RNA polymerase sigma factor [Spongiactinospora rosea]
MDDDAERAFREFVTARSPALMRVAYLLAGGDQHAAEDLLQSALARTFAKWRSIESPEAYVRQAMYRQQVSWWRLAWRRNEMAVAEPPETSGPDEAHSAELKIVVRRALARLTPRQRAVLVLRYFEDLPESTVAAQLGCTVGTVRSTAHRALARLRELSPELRALDDPYTIFGEATA